MKRSTKHIKKTLAYIEKCWKQYPELRLSQLIQNATGAIDIYFLEDIDIIKSVKMFRQLKKEDTNEAWKKADRF